MATLATGPFEVTLNPQAPDDKAEGSTLARMSIEKQYRGDLEAIARGEMLTVFTNIKSSAGYVAIERVTGTLRERKGSFVLQHSGTMTSSAQQQSITVVPASESGRLKGIAGKRTVKIADEKHSYDFEYALPEAP